jgi:hypothetical protein
MDVKEWQSRLDRYFSKNGVIGNNLFDIFEQEKEYGYYFINIFKGQDYIINAFQSFCLETFNKAINWISSHGWPNGLSYYSPILFDYM